jgi:hypothetical protein
MPDLNFQDLSTVQSGLQPKPVTVTAAATIAPTTFLTLLTGATAVTTITPPVTGTHMLCIVPGGATGFAAGGNVTGGTTTVASRACLLVFNPATNGYTVVTGAAG